MHNYNYILIIGYTGLRGPQGNIYALYKHVARARAS